MARPPMSKFFSTIDARRRPSRAPRWPATSPPAPAPMTTTSASRSQAIASAAGAAWAGNAAVATAPTAAPEVRKLRRSIAALGRSSGPSRAWCLFWAWCPWVISTLASPALDQLSVLPSEASIFAAGYGRDHPGSMSGGGLVDSAAVSCPASQTAPKRRSRRWNSAIAARRSSAPKSGHSVSTKQSSA